MTSVTFKSPEDSMCPRRMVDVMDGVFLIRSPRLCLPESLSSA